ncbi:hypothetical protein G7046_g7612 [Stylonectria norvegica]|nr:hypothetical protein G7046_g7612 [Stylonectria norvegica]
MSETSDLKRHHRVKHLPRRLWRVRYSSCQDFEHLASGDIVASDWECDFTDEAELRDAIRKHLDWRSRTPSCFLSVFTDERHARNWAKLISERCDWVRVCQIATIMLRSSTCIFDPSEMVGQHNNELLFLHQIPSLALIDSSEPDGSSLTETYMKDAVIAFEEFDNATRNYETSYASQDSTSQHLGTLADNWIIAKEHFVRAAVSFTERHDSKSRSVALDGALRRLDLTQDEYIEDVISRLEILNSSRDL